MVTLPLLSTLDVCWSGDNNLPPQETIDLINREMPWNNNAILEIQRGLPKLQENLVKCLESWELTYPIST